MTQTAKTIRVECTNCHTIADFREFQGACAVCGEKLVEARYELDKINVKEWLQELEKRPPTLWRYHEVLPIYDVRNAITLHEGGTPLIKSQALAASLGLKHLYFKDERQGPTGSFKDRQATVAISALKEKGVNNVVVASTGNVAIAYAAYGARAGIHLWSFFPQLTPSEKMREAALYGSEIIKTTGTYDQTKALAANFAARKGLFLDKGIKSVAATESMKTMAYEIAEQLGRELDDGQRWRAPDWFLQGVSGGLGPIGVGKGFREMMSFGLVDKMPAFGLVQSTGCAPMVHAFERGQRVATPLEKSETIIVTLATGNPGRAYEILYDYVQLNGGHFNSATDEEAFNAIRVLAQLDGISVEPAAGVTFAGLIKMVREGVISPDEVVVVNVSGHTLPVEKTILGDEWQRLVDLSKQPTVAPVPEEDLSDAVAQLGVGDKLHRVVIIEDNQASARLMSRVLASYKNSEVYLAHNGEAGLEMIRTVEPDLVITDLMMPDVDGFAVVRAMRDEEALRDTPLVVVTAKDLTAAEREFLDERADMVLQKGSFITDSFMQDLLERLS